MVFPVFRYSVSSDFSSAVVSKARAAAGAVVVETVGEAASVVPGEPEDPAQALRLLLTRSEGP